MSSVPTRPISNIGLFSCNLEGFASLAVGTENRNFSEAVRRSRNRAYYDVNSFSASRPKDLVANLGEKDYKIVIFSGHGGGVLVGKDHTSSEGSSKITRRLIMEEAKFSSNPVQGIYLEDNSKEDEPYFLTAQKFLKLTAGLVDNVDLFIFNTCNSNLFAQEVSEKTGVFALGNKGPIDDSAAIEYITAFGDGIFSGTNYVKAHKVANNSVSFGVAPTSVLYIAGLDSSEMNF